MTPKEKLAALRAQYVPSNDNNGGNKGGQFNNYYPFWNMKSGQRTVLRFLPDKDTTNPRGFMVEKVTHKLEINGAKKQVPCLSMYGEDCPVCAVSQAYYKAKDEINGKRYWRSKQYIAQVLVVDDPLPVDPETGESHAGKVRFVSLGYQIYNIIKEAFASEDDPLESIPYDFEEGYDFIIKRTENGTYPSYTNGTKFHSKQRALTEAETVAANEGMVVLSTLLPANPGFDKVNAQLEAEQTGGTVEEDTPPRRAPAPRAPAPAAEDDYEAPQRRAPAPAPAPAADGGDDDVDEMLMELRNRRAGRK